MNIAQWTDGASDLTDAASHKCKAPAVDTGMQLSVINAEFPLF